MFHRKKKTHIKPRILALVVVAGIFGVLFTFYEADRSGSGTALVSPSLDPETIARLALDFGDGTKREFEGEILPPMSALDVLYSATLASKIEMNYQPTSEGTVIENIAGKSNGDAGRSWQLYVNGGKIMGDPALYMINPSDSLEWKYE